MIITLASLHILIARMNYIYLGYGVFCGFANVLATTKLVLGDPAYNALPVCLCWLNVLAIVTACYLGRRALQTRDQKQFLRFGLIVLVDVPVQMLADRLFLLNPFWAGIIHKAGFPELYVIIDFFVYGFQLTLASFAFSAGLPDCLTVEQTTFQQTV